jgi:uncharacterized caspase-like protein
MAKRALLVGVNKYQIPGADLRGCVNDVNTMAATLEEVYGFARSDLTLLLDEQATKAAMQQQIAALVDGASAGDVLYFHYSGHGSNVPDTSGDEADHRDEILCPHDLDWNDPLIDDWLRSTFDRLHPKASLTVVMDCCHSGSNTREPPRPPGGPEPEVIARFLANPDDVERGGAFTGTPRRLGRRRPGQDVHDVDITETLVAGCRDDQTSADADINGVFNGALTYYLVNAIRDDPEGTYRSIHAATAAGLYGNYPQVPQLEGRAPRFDQKFLSALE